MSQTQVQLVGNVVTGAVFAGIVTATEFSLNGQSLVSGIGIATEGGTVGTGATVLDFRGAGISTVTVSSGIGTIFIEGGEGGGGGASVTTSDTAPNDPADGDLWYDSVGGRLYVYYEDPNSSQWVDAAPQGGGDAGFSKLEVGNTKAEIIDTGSDGRFVVTTEGTGRMTVDSSGRTLLGGVTANANGGVLQLSSGITFPATAVAATDANTLDDYEEGTWTPAYSSASNTWSYTTQIGRYVKIGKCITYTFAIDAICTAVNNLNAQVSIIVPFTDTGGDNGGRTYGSAMFGYSNQTHIIRAVSGSITWLRSASAADGNGYCNTSNWPAATSVRHVGTFVTILS